MVRALHTTAGFVVELGGDLNEGSICLCILIRGHPSCLDTLASDPPRLSMFRWVVYNVSGALHLNLSLLKFGSWDLRTLL